MKNFKYWWILPFTLLFVFATACKDDNEDPNPAPGATEFETMTNYMAANGMDLPDVISSWIIAVPAEADLDQFLADYYIIDIRRAEDFENGHIEGAVNSTLKDVVNTAADARVKAKTPLIVCYSGQTAGRAVVALRLSGYPDAKVLKFGMSQWAEETSGPWVSKTGDNGNYGVGHSNWTNGPVETNQEFGYPQLNTNQTQAQEILRIRVQAMLDNTEWGVKAQDVLDTPNNYFINNFWDETDVDHYGHIKGAFRIKPLTIENDELKHLDPSKAVCTYCWTGQTSSMITAWLDVLGYNSKSLTYGSNNMIYNDLESHKFTPPTVDLPVVTE